MSDRFNFKTLKKYFLNLLYNITVVIAFLLLFELTIRLFFPEIQLAGTSKSFFVSSLYSSSRGLKANTTAESNGVEKSTNEYHSWGYSGNKERKNKILFLGDSVTMGVGVENDSTFAGILNKHFTVINPSIVGYSSYDYVNVFKSLVEENRYDIGYDAVCLFWTLNDIYADTFVQEEVTYTPGDNLYNIINFFRHNSKAYIYLKSLISDRAEVYYNFDRKFYSENNELFVKSTKNLIYISEICKELGVDFIIFLLPYEYQIRNYTNNEILKEQKILSRLLKSYGIQVIDCIEAFKEYFHDSKDYYLYGDGIHFSEEGHRLLADFILKKVSL